MVVVNFKTYVQGTGEMAVQLARICARVANKTGIRIVVAPQLGDMRACHEAGVECWAQHVDGFEPDRHTGFVTIEEIIAAGGTGTILNHSEHRILVEDVSRVIERSKRFGGFQIGVCAGNLEEMIELAKLYPSYICYEPPELVGSRDKTVATEKPEVVQQAVNAVPVPLLIGAGVHTVDDIKVGMKLGAAGVLISTGVVLAIDPEKELTALAEAFKN